MNKQFISGFLIAFIILGLLGCASLFKKNEGVIGKTTQQFTKLENKVDGIEKTRAQKDDERLTHIGAWSEGTEYALEKVTNAPPDVTVAIEMNDRIQALSNKPDFNEVKEVKAIVDKLLSEVQSTREAGVKALLQKDKEIESLNIKIVQLNDDREVAIDNVFKLGNKNALLTDQYKATLGEMDSWFGLGAVWYGLKKFVVSSLWILGIGGILFLILRIASMSNPIAASIFGIFNMIGSWIVNIIKVIVPKAVDMAGHVTTGLFNAYKSTLTKLVDAIQMAKVDADKNGKTVDIKTVLDDIAKSMNTDEKKIVDEIKTSLNWK